MTQFTGSGPGRFGALVNSSGEILARAVSVSEEEHVNVEGDAYNINTKDISLTSTSDSAVFYFKNGESRDVFVSGLAIGIGSAGTKSEVAKITVIKNPTAGTIVSGASAVAINSNRNFGSSNELADCIVYKGAEGNTFTDGTDYAYFYGTSPRGFFDLNTVVRKGNSIGVKINTSTTAGTTIVYVALICHLLEDLPV